MQRSVNQKAKRVVQEVVKGAVAAGGSTATRTSVTVPHQVFTKSAVRSQDGAPVTVAAIEMPELSTATTVNKSSSGNDSIDRRSPSPSRMSSVGASSTHPSTTHDSAIGDDMDELPATDTPANVNGILKDPVVMAAAHQTAANGRPVVQPLNGATPAQVETARLELERQVAEIRRKAASGETHGWWWKWVGGALMVVGVVGAVAVAVFTLPAAVVAVGLTPKISAAIGLAAAAIGGGCVLYGSALSSTAEVLRSKAELLESHSAEVRALQSQLIQVEEKAADDRQKMNDKMDSLERRLEAFVLAATGARLPPATDHTTSNTRYEPSVSSSSSSSAPTRTRNVHKDEHDPVRRRRQEPAPSEYHLPVEVEDEAEVEESEGGEPEGDGPEEYYTVDVNEPVNEESAQQ